MEGCLNEFYEKDAAIDVNDRKQIWRSLLSKSFAKLQEEDYLINNNRDVIRQLIVGFGFRVTAIRENQTIANNNNNNHAIRTVLLSSCDPKGVQILVTAMLSKNHDDKNLSSEKRETSTATFSSSFQDETYYPYLDNPQHIMEFYNQHNGRQGIAVLAFDINSKEELQTIYKRYQMKHPNLLGDNRILEYKNNDCHLLEVYAYYASSSSKEVDRGTKLRFISNSSLATLPGLHPVPATFDSSSYPCYNDHWVSNVHSRTSFLEILHDTLGFTPKVDFNAGVVAAGEAQIESTVTGNDTSSFISFSIQDEALQDSSQIFLPINNALSTKGHVFAFLHEIGQGIQHVASRVSSLPEFVQRANDIRNITGEGLSFLFIPRSYYGVLTPSMIVQNISWCSDAEAQIIWKACEATNIINPDGAVDLTLTKDDIEIRLFQRNSTITTLLLLEEDEKYHLEKKDKIIETILFSRYCNLYALLRNYNLPEQSYIDIVRNQILVDVQGEDLLFQIFTSKILQRRPSEEAPFFEFIQRVCGGSFCSPSSFEEKGYYNASDSTKPPKLKPGCGGFGIRNFLTLFLSIEVSKAMSEGQAAKLRGDEIEQAYAEKRVALFTEQLNESNPILTEISDCMTAEGRIREQMTLLQDNQGKDNQMTMDSLREQMDAYANAKLAANKKLMECSSKYNILMKELRLEHEEESSQEEKQLV